MSSTGFLITTVGQAAATVANPGGPYIHITEFRCGSGVNYTPPGYVEGVSATTQTALQGSTLFTSAPAAWNQVDDDTIEVMLLIPATQGSFNFGEVGIYLEDGTLFAICVFDSLQEHVHAVGNQAGTNWKIRARLKLQQIPAICNVTLLVSQTLLEVPNWPSLIRPVDQPSGSNAVIVHDNNSSDDPVFVVRDNDTEWGLVGFHRVLQGSVADGGASSTTTTLTHPDIANLFFEMPNTTSRYMVKFNGGAMRKITAHASATQIGFLALGAAPTGAFSIWEEDGSGSVVAWADTAEYNTYVANFNPYWVTPTGSFSGSNKGLNQSAIPTLSARVTDAQWTTLLNAVKAVCQVHGVSIANITGFTNFLYRQTGGIPFGLQTLEDRWDALVAKIAAIESARLTFDDAYQDASVLVTHDDATFFSDRNYDFLFNYSDLNHRNGLLNGGHRLILTPSVISPANASWVSLQTMMTQIGTLDINDNGVVRTGPGGGTEVTTSGLGLYTLAASPTFTQLYQYTHTASGWRMVVSGQTTAEDIRIRIRLLDTVSPYAYGGSPGTVRQLWTGTRPSSALVNTAVMAFPTVSVTQS